MSSFDFEIPSYYDASARLFVRNAAQKKKKNGAKIEYENATNVAAIINYYHAVKTTDEPLLEEKTQNIAGASLLDRIDHFF